MPRLALICLWVLAAIVATTPGWASKGGGEFPHGASSEEDLSSPGQTGDLSDTRALSEQAKELMKVGKFEEAFPLAQERLFETVPLIPLTQRKSAWAYRSDVAGTIPSPVENLFFGLHLLGP